MKTVHSIPREGNIDWDATGSLDVNKPQGLKAELSELRIVRVITIGEGGNFQPITECLPHYSYECVDDLITIYHTDPNDRRFSTYIAGTIVKQPSGEFLLNRTAGEPLTRVLLEKAVTLKPKGHVLPPVGKLPSQYQLGDEVMVANPRTRGTVTAVTFAIQDGQTVVLYEVRVADGTKCHFGLHAKDLSPIFVYEKSIEHVQV